jgi:hypothetical protein
MIDEHCLNVRLSNYFDRHGDAPPEEATEREMPDSVEASPEEDAERR